MQPWLNASLSAKAVPRRPEFLSHIIYMKVLAVLTVLLASAGPSLAGDPALGATVFKKCAACHAIGEGAKNRLGPELNGLVGRHACETALKAGSDALLVQV